MLRKIAAKSDDLLMPLEKSEEAFGGAVTTL